MPIKATLSKISLTESPVSLATPMSVPPVIIHAFVFKQALFSPFLNAFLVLLSKVSFDVPPITLIISLGSFRLNPFWCLAYKITSSIFVSK